MLILRRWRWTLLVVMLIGLLVISPQVYAQTNIAYQAPVIAYVGEDGNVYVNSLNATSAATALTSDAFGQRDFVGFDAERIYSFLRWSPDGTSLAFVGNEPYGSTLADLYVANSGQTPTRIGQQLISDFGIVWSPTGAEIGYALRSEQPIEGSISYTYTFLAVPRAGGTPRTVGTFKMEYFGEGHPLSDIADEMVRAEGYPSGNGVAMAWLETGLVHPLNAVSNYGLVFSDFSGQQRWVVDRVSDVVISPDRQYAVGRQYPDTPQSVNFNVVVIDLATGALTQVASAPNVDAVGWNADSTQVLFSSAIRLNSVELNMALPNAVATFGDFPREGVDYTVNLMSVPVTGGAATLVMSYPGRAFTLIAPIDSTRIAFSLVESSFAAVTTANAGASVEQIMAAKPKLLTGSYTFGAAQPNLMNVEARRPVISTVAVFIGIAAPASQPPTPAVVNCPDTLPAQMVVGKSGRVLPGAPNNLNTQPSPPSRDPNSQRITLIPAGATFTVIGGPICGYGYTWWQVNYNGTLGWTAEAGDGAYWIEPLP
jgi:Tol biopolymer transport system component